DLFSGLQEGLGDLSRMIVSDITFNISDKSIDSQIDVLQASGAKILVFDGAPAVAALALRRMAEIDWHPVFLLDNASASIANALRPAGLENSIGVIRVPQGRRRSRLEGRSRHEGLVVVHGQILSR